MPRKGAKRTSTAHPKGEKGETLAGTKKKRGKEKLIREKRKKTLPGKTRGEKEVPPGEGSRLFPGEGKGALRRSIRASCAAKKEGTSVAEKGEGKKEGKGCLIPVSQKKRVDDLDK